MRPMTDKELRIFEKDKLTCADVDALLGDYVDQDLAPSLTARVQAHIQTCDECQRSESGYREVISLARSLREEKPVPGDVQNRLRSALNRRLGLNLPIK